VGVNLDDEGASASAQTRTDLYPPIQASRSLFHDGEAKTATARVVPPGPAIELLKHSLAFSHGDPRSVVSDAEHERTPSKLQLDDRYAQALPSPFGKQLVAGSVRERHVQQDAIDNGDLQIDPGGVSPQVIDSTAI
jgi:hypothetical protein